MNPNDLVTTTTPLPWYIPTLVGAVFIGLISIAFYLFIHIMENLDEYMMRIKIFMSFVTKVLIFFVASYLIGFVYMKNVQFMDVEKPGFMLTVILVTGVLAFFVFIRKQI